MKLKYYLFLGAFSVFYTGSIYSVPLDKNSSPEKSNIINNNDAALARSLAGNFNSVYAVVNGVRLHYVEGGKGEPLILLPGWPQTWWEFNKIMPELAQRYRVIAVDIRGMGSSDKPATGYDKKTMAKDIHDLVEFLGYKKVSILGHDIGSMVAYALAANYPDTVKKIVMLDTAHPDEMLYDMPLIPKNNKSIYHPWWFAFNQVDTLPEYLLQGHFHFLMEWLFSRLKNPTAISANDRKIYARAYGSSEAIRAGNGWYKAFRQDIEDEKKYGKIKPPILMLASENKYPALNELMPGKGENVRTVKMNSSHYIAEDDPDETIKQVIAFID